MMFGARLLLSIPLVLGLLPPAANAQEAATGHALGPPDAHVVVIAFTDFGCSACAVFARRTFPAVREEYLETGKVHWVEVPFVLGPFPNSQAAATAAACAADQGMFWDMHQILFRRQAQWAQAADPRERFGAFAAAVGLDRDTFRKCQGAGARDETDRGNLLAEAGRVRATPTFFINGERLEGALDVDAFRRILDEALGRR